MKVNQLKGGVILSYVQMGLGLVISLIYTPIMLRLLGQSEYGLYNISSSVISYLSLLNFGFGSSYVRFYMKYRKNDDEEGIRSLNGLFMTVFSVLGIIALLAGIVLAFNCRLLFDKGLSDSELGIIKILMIIMSVNMAISFPASVFVSFITAKEKFVFQKLVNMLKTVFSPFVTLLILFLGFRSVGMTLVVTFISIVTDVINVTFCIKKLKMRFSFRHLDKRLLKEIAGFSGFIALNMIVDEINWNVDKFLLGRFRGSVATAIYGVSATLNSYYRSISTAITNVFTPRIHKIANGEDADRGLTEIFTRIGRIQFLLLMLIFTGFLFFGQRFVSFWAGQGYDDSYYIALLLMGPVTLPLIQGLGIEIQRAKNMHKFRSVAYFIMAIANVLISIPLCKAFGGIGCALGTAISVVLSNGLIMNWYYKKKIGLDIWFFWKSILKILPGLIPPAIYGILIHKFTLTKPVYVYILLLAGYVAIYSASCWILSMNDYEKGIVKPILKKLRIKRSKKQ